MKGIHMSENYNKNEMQDTACKSSCGVENKITDKKENIRDNFLRKNHGWIELLGRFHNDPELKTLNMEFNELVIDLDKIKNIGKTPFKPQAKEIKCSERAFAALTAKWMYENLKIVTRGGNRLIEIENFGVDEVNFLLSFANFLLSFASPSVRKQFVLDRETGGVLAIAHRIEASYIPGLAQDFYQFMTYIDGILQGGLKNKAKLGIYKVGVCPYKKLRDEKECGKIFIGQTWQQNGCKEHTEKIKNLRNNRRKKESKILA